MICLNVQTRYTYAYAILSILSCPTSTFAQTARPLRHLVLNDMMKPRPVLLIRALWLTACTLVMVKHLPKILYEIVAGE